MDAFEIVRREAEELHKAVVAKGVNPLDVFSLVQAAVAHLDLELVWLAPSDPALKGAHALFDEQSGTICCENIGEAQVRALLVAHELGHAKVHAGSASAVCSSHDIDVTRSTEAAPVGLQRVEDYGAHERRELQANVFGRELVLPRSLAARLHLDEGRSARSIADAAKLPIALVRQQLFDALLLPAAQEAPKEEGSSGELTPDGSQDTAAEHRGTPFQLQAGPGTGKTRTLVKRVLSLLKDGIDPAAILILTFSNRAAGELSERLTKAAPDAAPRIWIGTFHAFGLDLVRRHHDRLGLKPNPPLFDRSDAIAVLEEILPTLPLVHYRNLWDPAMVLRDVVSAISRAKDEMVDTRAYRALATEMKAQADADSGNEKLVEHAGKCMEIAGIYELYEAAMRKHGGIDFGDLIMRPTQLLESDEEIRIAAQLRHRHVLVDEYQDVNRASARLLKAIADKGERLWVVGDARQSIYRFRGASSTNMARFVTDYPGAKAAPLEVNYRSTQKVVDTFVSIAPRMSASEGMIPLKLKAARGDGPARPQIRRFDTLDEEGAGVCASIRELEKDGIPLRKQAILCRSNARLNEIAIALEGRGIPVLHLGSLFEREEVRDLLGIMSLAVDFLGDAIVRVGAMPRYALSLQDVYAVSRHLRELDKSALKGLRNARDAAGLSEQGKSAIDLLVKDLDGLSESQSSWDYLSTYILDRTDLAKVLHNANTIPEQMRAVAVWQFLNFVREQSPVGFGSPIQRTLDRVRQLVLLAEERDLRQVPPPALHLDAVRLMTVHGSKGLEFEAVHVPGLTIQSFPSQRRGLRCPPPAGMIDTHNGMSVADDASFSHDQEEECLFFVALSRARTYLRLYLARKQPNGNNRAPSPYLAWIPGNLVEDFLHAPQLALPDGAGRSSQVSVAWPEDWALSDSRLGSYEKCPRRFFYTHVMGLRGARKTTAFSRTHDCIYDLLSWLGNERQSSEPTLEQAEKAFEDIWQMRGPVEHAFANDYRRLATRLIGALIRAGAGRRFRESQPLAIDFPNGRVLVEPDELAELPDGSIVIRRVRTGYKRSDEYDKLEYTLYHLAAQQYGGRVTVQALHLTDEVDEIVPITDKKISNRRAKSDGMLAEIKRGHFPVEIDAVSCPRCPHFFICAATPNGALNLKS